MNDLNTIEQLVPVFIGTINGKPVQVCDARALHTYLGVGRDFSNWIKDRIEKFGFEENQDYLLAKFSEQLPSGTKHRIDYHLTLNMAKELGMVENNEKGRTIRRYFIEMEKKALGASTATISPDKSSVLIAARAWANMAQIQADNAKNQADMAKNEADMAKNQADTAKNQADMAKNQADMAKNQADMAKNQADTAKNQADIAKNQADMTKQQADMAKNQADLAKTQADVAQAQADKARLWADEYERNMNVVIPSLPSKPVTKSTDISPISPRERAFIHAWWECFGNKTVTASDLYRAITTKQCQILNDSSGALLGDIELWTAKKLGYALRRWSQLALDGYRVQNIGKSSHGITWRLELLAA